jgi:hypothetical protein
VDTRVGEGLKGEGGVGPPLNNLRVDTKGAPLRWGMSARAADGRNWQSIIEASFSERSDRGVPV